MRVELESWAIQKKTGENWDVRESLKTKLLALDQIETKPNKYEVS